MDLKRYIGVSFLDDDDEDYDDMTLMNITLIDEILKEFTTQYKVDKLLSEVQKYIGDIGITYKFRGVTYDGTITDYRTLNPTDNSLHDQLTIRLSSDGFRYPRPNWNDVAAVIRSHKSMHDPSGIPGYHVMKKEYLKDMRTLAEIQKLCNANKTIFLYNPKYKRIDVEFFDSNMQIPLKITFEVGSPRGTSKEEYMIDLFAML